jgi:hypothetical protein
VSAVVRGFYDDNPDTQSSRNKEDTFGIQVSPSVHLNLPLEQTFISLGYIYSLLWYDDRDPSTDQSHEFNGKLRHQFSPRHDIAVDDSFVFTTEPTVVDHGQIITTPLRTRSNVLHNRGAIEDNIGLTRRFSLSLGYVNNWYDYDQENLPGDPPNGVGSRSALLDRIEHLIRADARYLFTPKVAGLVGYTFGLNDFTGDDVIGFDNFGRKIKSDERNNYTHYIYVGADVDLTTQLRASARVGAEIVDFHEIGETDISPYADASLTYVYLPGDSVELGVRHARHATDASGVDAKGEPTLDAESTVVYAQITHKITEKFVGSVLGQFQHSDFNNGANDGESEDLYLIGVNFSYAFNRHFAADAGYNYDFLLSDLDRGYHRNRAYVGVKVTY